MKYARNAWEMLLLLCLAAGMLTGCFAVRSEEIPEAAKDRLISGAVSPDAGAAVSGPSAEPITDPFPTGWDDEREALVLSLVRQMYRDGEQDDFTVYGEVGGYTLCCIPYGGDDAIVEDVLAGYCICAGTVGYPSATHLYLVGDGAIYTLQAAYTQGVIDRADMGELYALLPEGAQGGYDPDAEDFFSWKDTDWFGFEGGVYRPE